MWPVETTLWKISNENENFNSNFNQTGEKMSPRR